MGNLALNKETTIQPVIYLNRCDGCGKCTLVCPAEALAVEGGKLRIVHTNCDYCGECEAACPTGAITCPYEIVLE